MKNRLTHFALYVDELKRAQEFYSKIFGWKFPSYGPGDFSQITTGKEDGEVLIGALQSRSYTPIDQKILGMEGTIQVDDIDALSQRVLDHGGKIVMQKSKIPNVGTLIKFLDTEGNLICAMERDSA